MKKQVSVVLMLMMLFALPAHAERLEAMPALLCFSQITGERDYVRSQVYVQCTYPETANAQVNAALRDVIDALAARGREHMPQGSVGQIPAYLDVGATISRVGLRWMSFLSIARTAYEREQTYVDFDARVYDMETGAQILLTDLFDADSEAWNMLAGAVAAQLSAYFPDTEADPAALARLCGREALESAAFTLTPARLTLHYRADALYAEKNTLMHVSLYFSQLRPLMTERAQENTDNGMFKFIALTYDDGGARGTSNGVMDQLRAHGASATFFIVGTTIRNNHDILCREHDAGYAVASHNYEHVYKGLTNQKLLDWQARFNRELSAVIGTTPAYMRAPGGQFKRYINAQCGLPLIQWSVLSGDADSKNVAGVAGTVLKHAEDGAVVLMHDLNPRSPQYTALILPELTNRGYLCVTVDELFDHYGVPLLPDTLYYSCEEEAARQSAK